MTPKTLPYDVLPDNSIRLLTLLPGDRSTPLECELHRADLPGLANSGEATKPTFEALSYTWGGSNKPQRIICGNSAIEITQSLFEALMDLRQAKTARTLWIDAVCIDQGDADEKKKQLHHMTSIYRHATQVVIWLGLAEESTGRAVDLIQQAANCLRREYGRKMPPSNLPDMEEPFSDEKNEARGFPPIEDLGH
jgi:hypothetical protein